MSGLILHGGDEHAAKLYKSILEILSPGWNLENQVFRQIFTARFIPDGNDAQIGWYNELCRKTMSSTTASRLLDAGADVDVFDLPSRVSVPTLVLQTAQDQITPMSEARVLARHIPNAELVVLDSRNHILLKQEAAWSRFKDAVLDFTARVSGTDPLRRPDMQCLSLSSRSRTRVRQPVSSARTARRSSRRAEATTSSPCPLSARTQAAPMPLDAPVTRAVL